MYYTHNKSSKFNKNIDKLKTVGLSIAVIAASALTGTLPSMVSAKGGVNGGGGSTVDTSTCNNAQTFLDYNATFPAGTIKAGVTPEFSLTGVSTCAAQVNARFVSITKAYTYDYINNQYVLANLPGYPVTEVSKDITVKPGVFAIKNRIADKPVNGVYQMFTTVNMYMSSSFDVNGRLLPDAVLLGSDVANWTQTNFITL